MQRSSFPIAGYVLAATLGAAVGGIAIAVATRAIPGMMSRIMASMMTRMGGEGCNPGDM